MINEFSHFLGQKLHRRMVLQGIGASAAAMAVPNIASAMRAETLLSSANDDMLAPFNLNFLSLPKAWKPDLEVAQGYRVNVLMRWGDAVLEGGGNYSPSRWNAAKQALSFGYNNDFIAYFAIEGSSNHGLLHVNHEYSSAKLMFEGDRSGLNLSPEEMRIEMAAQGGSVIEVRRENLGDGKFGDWKTIPYSRYGRRIDANTPITLTGPAAGNERLQTEADPEGRTVLGTFANCSGGQTPWGTVLMAEENFDGYFQGKSAMEEKDNHQRYSIGKRPYYNWHQLDARFDVAEHPHEPNRFGWVVEYDPYDPQSMPKKRTALGRFKHETATFALSADGRAVIYSGDDSYFEYLYRFVSRDKIGENNADLLDHGILSVARFEEDGTLLWLPLVHGEGALTKENGFESQADILIEARRAGDVMGATPMDRPEGITVHSDGRVYVALTKNPKRDHADAANPRLANQAGHIISLLPPSGDHGADFFDWDITLLAGNPDEDAVDYGARAGVKSWFANPDNLVSHRNGGLWVATDGMPATYGLCDGLYAMNPNESRVPKCFLRAPMGAEVTGPCFTPDGNSLFVSIQHPAEGSGFDSPSTRWPDFDQTQPPKPSIVAITQHPIK